LKLATNIHLVQRLITDTITTSHIFMACTRIQYVYSKIWVVSKPQHNSVFVVLFKLTTCFGLCFRPSSGHKIIYHCRKLYNVSYIIRYMEL